jgi:hypothetical protein
MKSDTFNKIVREMGEEMNLSHIEIAKAIKSSFKSMIDEIAEVDVRKIKTKEEYLNILQESRIANFGKLLLKKSNYLTKVKRILD